MSKEIWVRVVIDGLPTMYLISNQGRLMSEFRGESKIVNGSKNNNGYIAGCLHLKVKKTSILFHRIVGAYFVKNECPENYNEINHLNGIKDDNRADNLEWTNGSGNVKHAYKTGLKVAPRGENSGKSVLTNELVLEIVKSKDSCVTLSKKLGLNKGIIERVRRGETWGHITGISKKPRKVLTKKEVLEIFLSPLSAKELAIKHGKNISLINDIKIGRRWSSITGKRSIRVYTMKCEQEILEIFNSNERVTDLAIKHGMCKAAISKIKSGKSYSELTGKVYVRKRKPNVG